jgi:carbonic anhydrase/acetyltransferase-like protein (isoleucine patch superfamily)
MTIEQLQSIFIDATLETWHQHTNGGGWVQNTATVDESAYVGKNALVYGNARVLGTAWVSGNAWVSGTAWVSRGEITS